jgi:hypothetical protein
LNENRFRAVILFKDAAVRFSLNLPFVFLTLLACLSAPRGVAAAGRTVSVSVWVHQDGIRVWFAEPLMNSWWLPANPSPEDFAPLLQDPDLARLERSAKMVVWYEKAVGEALVKELVERLTAAGFGQVKAHREYSGLISSKKRRYSLRSSNSIPVYIRDRAESGEIEVEALLYLPVCQVVVAEGKTAETKNCHPKGKWTFDRGAAPADFKPVVEFLDRAFCSQPLRINYWRKVPPAFADNLAVALESAGFRWVRVVRPPPPGAVYAKKSAWSKAWRGKGTSRGGLLLGLNYSFGLDASHLKDFLYPSFGWSYDWKGVHLDGIIPLPWLLIDFIVGGIGFITGGDDFDLPIWEGLNDEDEPGRLEFLTFRGRYAYLTADGHKLDAGLVLDVWNVSPLVDGKFRGLTNFDLGLSAGYGLHSKYASMNLAVDLGNGFNQLSSWNPFAGADLMGRLKLGEVVGLYLKVMFRVQRYDFGYVRWEPMMAVDCGLFFYVMP